MVYSFDHVDDCPQTAAMARYLNIEMIDLDELSTPFYDDETQEASQVIPTPTLLNDHIATRVEDVN